MIVEIEGHREVQQKLAHGHGHGRHGERASRHHDTVPVSVHVHDRCTDMSDAFPRCTCTCPITFGIIHVTVDTIPVSIALAMRADTRSNDFSTFAS